MTGRERRIIVTVSSDGRVDAVTEGMHGDACLDYIAVLEDLLAARTVDSTYTADYTKSRTGVRLAEEAPDVDRA